MSRLRRTEGACASWYHLQLHQGNWNHALVIESVHEISQYERFAGEILLVSIFGDQFVGEHLTGDVAAAIARLPQIQQLLECGERVLGIGPSPRRPLALK